jgi:hypothetical protein
MGLHFLDIIGYIRRKRGMWIISLVSGIIKGRGKVA